MKRHLPFQLVWPLFGMLLGQCAGVEPRPAASTALPARPETLVRARLPASEHGETVVDPEDGLSPEEAAFLSLERNPRLRAVRTQRGLAQAEIVAAGLLPNPRFEGAWAGPVGGAEARATGYALDLAWNVTPLVSRGARVQSAEQRSRAVDLEVAWQEWQVAQGARLHAIRLVYLGRRITTAREAADYWQGRLRALREARAAFASTEIQVARAERSLAEWTLQAQELQRQAMIERAALALALGLAPAELPAPQTRWHPPPTAANAADLVAGLETHRMDLVALGYARRSTDSALRAAVLSRFPPIEVGVRATREVDGVQALELALQVALPIFDRNQGEVARQAAQQRQVDAEYEARLAQARSQVRRLAEELRLVEGERVTASAAEEAAIRLASLAERLARSGDLDPSLASDQQDRAFQARLRRLRVEQRYAELQVALSLESGRWLPE
ncbi:MAG: TolC family protein [Deltaproteobacteria bacterium]|nr:MAG: TolC family protein [Deltaproteobacteria bacterium]